MPAVLGLSPAEVEQRRLSIGGSDAGAVLGVDPFMSPQKLYRIKVGEQQPDPPNAQIKRGTVLEPIARRLYRELTKRQVGRSTRQTHSDHPWMTCHADGLLVDPARKAPGVLEIKCPSLWAFGKVKRQGLPAGYIAQMQHNLAVTNCAWGAFAIFNADLWELIHFDVERDDTFIEKLIETERDFWYHNVAAHVPPAEAPIEPTVAQQLEKMAAAAPGELIVRNDPDWADAARQWCEAEELLDTAAHLQDEAQATLKKLMGGHSAVEGAGLRVYWRQQAGRRTLDKGALAGAHPEIDLTKYEKQGKPFDVFLPFRVRAGVGD